MVYSVSDAVKDVLYELTFLRPAIEKDLLNYSALARFIQPSVSARLGVTPSIDAIIVAIRRNCEQIKNASPANAFDAVKSAKVTLRTDMTMFLINDWANSDVLDVIRQTLFKVDFKAGEKFYIFARSSEIVIICNSRLAPTLNSTIPSPAKIKFTENNLSIITVDMRAVAYDVPGILDFYTEKFDQAGVNLLEVFSTRGKISFLIRQKDAAKAYENMMNGLESIKTMQ